MHQAGLPPAHDQRDTHPCGRASRRSWVVGGCCRRPGAPARCVAATFAVLKKMCGDGGGHGCRCSTLVAAQWRVARGSLGFVAVFLLFLPRFARHFFFWHLPCRSHYSRSLPLTMAGVNIRYTYILVWYYKKCMGEGLSLLIEKRRVREGVHNAWPDWEAGEGTPWWVEREASA